MRWQPYGPNAVLLKFAEAPGDEAFARSCALARALEANPPAGLVDFVPAFTTLLLEFEPTAQPDFRKIVAELEGRLESEIPEGDIHEVPVNYNGPDLERVAVNSHLSIKEVVELHAAPTYKVYMIGFSPGFPYLGDLDPQLHTPRLASPRVRVPAGSVGIGGSHTGIYSVETPGGWNIIGSTEVKLFNPAQTGSRMFLLKAGDRVRFVPR